MNDSRWNDVLYNKIFTSNCCIVKTDRTSQAYFLNVHHCYDMKRRLAHSFDIKGKDQRKGSCPACSFSCCWLYSEAVLCSLAWMKSITANEGSPLAPIYSSTSSWSGIRDAILQALSKFIDLTNDLVDAANQDMIGWVLNNMCWLGPVHAMALIGVNLLKSLSWASMVHNLMR